ncbi:MAG: phage tail protein I [Bosea sp.]|nr:phage tail protein I [Bosea sp. (in: a-proteobacteria)]
MIADLDLAPPNATDLERELTRLSSRLDAIDPAVIEAIWDAWRCPAPLLPWLAWALSVDWWDDAWSEIQKRQAIADSPDYHRRKGTRSAVESIIALSGRAYEITEWFEQSPPGRRGTATVHVEAELGEILALSHRIRPLVMTSKPKSRAVFIGIGPRAPGSIVFGAGILDETITEISPYSYQGENADAGLTIGIGFLDETLTEIGTHA